MKPQDFAAQLDFARAMRRTRPTAIVHSGGRRTIFGCLCGARHTCATSYRQARHVEAWCEQHDTQCWPRFEGVVARRAPGWLDRQRDAVYSDDTH